MNDNEWMTKRMNEWINEYVCAWINVLMKELLYEWICNEMIE